MARREPGAAPKRRKKAVAKKEKPAKQKELSLSNRPATRADEEAFRVWAEKARRAYRSVRKALELVQSERGVLSGIYTSAKEAGIPAERVRILKLTLKQELKEPAEVLSEAREMAFQAKVLKSPLVQLGLFDGLLKEPSLEEYELMGEHAGRNGEPIDNAPDNPGSPQHTHWISGWKKGQKENVKALEKSMGAGDGEEFRP